MAKRRTYDDSDLKELMDNTGGWAHSRDDVLRHAPSIGTRAAR